MLVKIKPHSSLQKFFSAPVFKADLCYYADIHDYLRALHPKFSSYLKQLQVNKLEESFTFLDKNLKEITPDELFIRKAKAGDVIHIVPAIVGGGGKRGGILAALALAAFVFVLPAMVAGAPMLFGSAAVNAGATAAAAGGGTLATSMAIIQSSSFLSNLVVQAGLAILSNIFMSDTDQGEETRQNYAFGSLTNSTRVGTPVALNYGMTRVAGQLISGYVSSVDHSKTAEIDVEHAIYNYIDGES